MKKIRFTSMKALAIVFAFFLTTACSGNHAGNTPETETSEATGTANETQPSASGNQETVTITVWDQLKKDDIHYSVAQEIFKEFEDKYPHIKVDHKMLPEGTNDRQTFVTAMAGGSGPDAYQAAHFPIAQDWIKQGFALDLTAYWDQYADKDKYIESSLEAAMYEGKIYGLPNSMYNMGLLYNKRLFEQAGLDPDQPPKTWDEFVDAAVKLTKPAEQQYGYAMLGMEWADWYFEYYVWQAGGDLTAKLEDGSVELQFTSEPVVTALQFYKDMKWKHKVVQKNVLQDINDNYNDFYQGRAAMILTASNAFGGFVQNGMDLADLGFAPFPAGPSGKGPSQIGGAYWIINPESSKAKQDAAWQYITYLMSKEVQEKMLQFDMENGVMPNLLSVRTDVNPAAFAVDVPQDLVTGVNDAAKDAQLEYYLKERLTPYVVKAVQKVLTDEKADPKTELTAAQEAAQSEVADPFNQEIKGK